jgi:hypothetical protein
MSLRQLRPPVPGNGPAVRLRGAYAAVHVCQRLVPLVGLVRDEDRFGPRSPQRDAEYARREGQLRDGALEGVEEVGRGVGGRAHPERAGLPVMLAAVALNSATWSRMRRA